MNLLESLKSLVMRAAEPVVAPAPAVVEAPIEPAPSNPMVDPYSVGETDPRVHNMAPVEVIPVPAEESVNEDERPIDWDEEKRTDLPQRSIKRIAFLLKHETMAQTQERIFNDQTRYRLRRPPVLAKRYVNLNPQTVLVNPSVPVPTSTTWTK
jgi:hypothetical protein